MLTVAQLIGERLVEDTSQVIVCVELANQFKPVFGEVTLNGVDVPATVSVTAVLLYPTPPPPVRLSLAVRRKTRERP